MDLFIPVRIVLFLLSQQIYFNSVHINALKGRKQNKSEVSPKINVTGRSYFIFGLQFGDFKKE